MYTRSMIKTVENGDFPVTGTLGGVLECTDHYTHKITFKNGHVILCLSITDGLDWMNTRNGQGKLVERS